MVLRSVVDGASAVVLGAITGGDHTTNDDTDDAFQTGNRWACPDAWCQNGGAGSVDCSGSGSDNLLELPASVFADLRDGSFEIEVASVSSGTGHWASNRAILEISTDLEHASAFTNVIIGNETVVAANASASSSGGITMEYSDPATWSAHTSRSVTFPNAAPLVYEVTRTSTQVSGATYELKGDITVEAGATLMTPPILEIPEGRTLILGGHLMGAQHIVVTGEGARLVLKATASAAFGNIMEVGQFHWRTLTISGGAHLETEDVVQTITARSISLAANEKTGRDSLITARHTLVLRGHHIEIGAEGKINGRGLGYQERQGPGAPRSGTKSDMSGICKAASHGGVGAGQPWSVDDGLGGYGSIRRPTERGSGGWDDGQEGGAAVILEAVDELVLLTEHNRVNLSGSLKAGLNISGDNDDVFNTTHMACPYEAPTPNVPLSFTPAGTTRLLALRFQGARLDTVGPGPSKMAAEDITVINSPTKSMLGLGVAGNNSGVADSYANNWTLSSFLSTSPTNALSTKGNGLQLSTYANAWRVNTAGHGSRTYVAWYKGSQAEATAGADDPTCGVAFFGDYDEQTSYLSFGLDGGYVAVCLAGEASKARGSTLVSDDNWHMLAWVYDDAAKTITAYADVNGTIAAEVTFDATLCGNQGLCRLYTVGNGVLAGGAPYIQAPTALDDIQIYTSALSLSQLQDIRTVYTNNGTTFPVSVHPSGCDNEDKCAAGAHEDVELQIPGCVDGGGGGGDSNCVAARARVICNADANVTNVIVSKWARGRGMYEGQTLRVQQSAVGEATRTGYFTFEVAAEHLTDSATYPTTWPFVDTTTSEMSRGAGFVKIDGEIDVDAKETSTGAGSGGSIQIRSTGSLLGTGILKANGGGAGTAAYGGGGGRISVHCDCDKEDTLVKTAYGGESAKSTAVKRHGGAGTVYTNYTNVPNHVYVGNDGRTRDYLGFNRTLIDDNRGFISPQTHDDNVGTMKTISGISVPTHSETAGFVPDFTLDDDNENSSQLRRDFTSRIPTTLLFATEDPSLDFETSNQTTIHTLEITDGAHVVLTVPELEVGAPSDPTVAAVTRVHRLTGDGYGRLRVSNQTTLIVREEDFDFEFGHEVEATPGETFDLRVHLAIEHGGRVMSPKTVTTGGLGVAMRHQWAGLWSGPENFVLDSNQEMIVAASASTNVGQPGIIELDGSLTVSRGSKVEFKRCDLDSFCDVSVDLTVAKFLNISHQGQLIVGTRMSLACPSISIGESPSAGESALAVKGGKPLTIVGDFLELHARSKIDGNSGGHQVKRVKDGLVHPHWDDVHGYGQGPGSYETQHMDGQRTNTSDEIRLGYGGSHGGVGGYMYIWRTDRGQMKYRGGDPPDNEAGGGTLGYGSYKSPTSMGSAGSPGYEWITYGGDGGAAIAFHLNNAIINGEISVDGGKRRQHRFGSVQDWRGWRCWRQRFVPSQRKSLWYRLHYGKRWRRRDWIDERRWWRRWPHLRRVHWCG